MHLLALAPVGGGQEKKLHLRTRTPTAPCPLRTQVPPSTTRAAKPAPTSCKKSERDYEVYTVNSSSSSDEEDDLDDFSGARFVARAYTAFNRLKDLAWAVSVNPEPEQASLLMLMQGCGRVHLADC